MFRNYFPDEPIAIPAVLTAGLLLAGFLFMPPGLVAYMHESPWVFGITALGVTAFVFGVAQLLVSEIEFRGIRRFLLRSAFRMLTVLAITLVFVGTTYGVIGLLEAVAPEQMEAARISDSLIPQLIVMALICLPLVSAVGFLAFRTPRWGQRCSDWFWNTHKELNLTQLEVDRNNHLRSLTSKLPSWLSLRIPSDLEVELDAGTLEYLTRQLFDPYAVQLSSDQFVDLGAFIKLPIDEIDAPIESQRWYLTLFKLVQLEKALYAANEETAKGSNSLEHELTGLELLIEMHRAVLSKPTREQRDKAYERLVRLLKYIDRPSVRIGLRLHGLGYLVSAVTQLSEKVDALYNGTIEDFVQGFELDEGREEDEITSAAVNALRIFQEQKDFMIKLLGVEYLRQAMCDPLESERAEAVKQLQMLLSEVAVSAGESPTQRAGK